MARFKITEEQYKQITERLTEDDSQQNAQMTVNVPANGTPQQTGDIVAKELTTFVEKTGANPGKIGVTTNPTDNSQTGDNSNPSLQTSGRIITKRELTENRKKALNAKSKVYTFKDFIVKK